MICEGHNMFWTKAFTAINCFLKLKFPIPTDEGEREGAYLGIRYWEQCYCIFQRLIGSQQLLKKQLNSVLNLTCGLQLIFSGHLCQCSSWRVNEGIHDPVSYLPKLVGEALIYGQTWSYCSGPSFAYESQVSGVLLYVWHFIRVVYLAFNKDSMSHKDLCFSFDFITN